MTKPLLTIILLCLCSFCWAEEELEFTTGSLIINSDSPETLCYYDYDTNELIIYREHIKRISWPKGRIVIEFEEIKNDRDKD